MKINGYDSYYTVIKNTDEEEIMIKEYENDYNSFIDFITPNHYIGRKNDNAMLKWRKMRSQINHFNPFILYKWGRKMENSPRYGTCNVDVHRASYLKHLRTKKQLENVEQKDMIIPEWLFQEHIENQNKDYTIPKQ